MVSNLEHALAHAARGFAVFPIKPGAKAPPLLNGWPQRATRDLDEIRSMWLPVPDANIGIHCEGLIVLDVDTRKGGDDSLEQLEMIYELPDTLCSRTPSGGRHLYFRHSGIVANSVGKLGAGLDVRTRGGYVLGPGSTVGVGSYVWESELPIADAPDWLVLKIGTIPKEGTYLPKEGTSPPKTSTTTVPPVLDAVQAVVDRAALWLLAQDGAVQGQGGDACTFKIACSLRDLGVSQAQALGLMMNWNGLCSPPWSLDELGVKVRNAYSYGQNDPGTRAALPEDFPVVALEVQSVRPNAHPVRTSSLRLSEFANSEQTGPGYLVKGLLRRRTYAELFGAPGAGKTFVALDIAYHVAAGKPWMDRRVHPGVVLYLAYEGTGGLVKRAQALRQKYGNADVPLYVASAAFNLREMSGRKALGEVIAALPEKPALIVIDTFARALMGGDENSAQDVGAFNSAVASLIESTGACVTIVHHSGKNKAAGARGSSALLGAIDTELEVDDGQIIARKQRDVEITAPIGFKLVPLVVGLDEDGDDLTSCVVEPSAIVTGPLGKLTGNAARGFATLCELAPDNRPVFEHIWRGACKDFLPKRAAAFWDMKKILVQKGYVILGPDGTLMRKLE